jgi:hypothetical protein
MRRVLVPVLAAMLVAFGLAGSASAASSKATFDWHVGDALIQSLGIPAGDSAMADNGDVITLIGTGTFDAATKSATGSGTLVHHLAATGATETGTFTVTGG